MFDACSVLHCRFTHFSYAAILVALIPMAFLIPRNEAWACAFVLLSCTSAVCMCTQHRILQCISAFVRSRVAFHRSNVAVDTPARRDCGEDWRHCRYVTVAVWWPHEHTA